MLNKRSANFAELVWAAAAKVGNNAPRIADKIIKQAFPQTYSEAQIEGADRMLRTGVIESIKPLLRSAAATDHGTIDFSEINNSFVPIVRKLTSATYYVESINQYVGVQTLIDDPALLDDARRHMRRKGEECIGQANVLDELYAAVTK